MTWGEFKKLLDETDGVTDDMQLDYIDTLCFPEAEGLHIGCTSEGRLAVYGRFYG